MPAAIQVDALRKVFRVRERDAGAFALLRGLVAPRFRSVEAVAGLTFTIAPGERVACIGPNGAGKSTTIKLLTGILHPTAGTVRVLDLDPVRDRRRVAYRIGTVFGQRSLLWYHLPARDSLRLLARIYDLDRATAERRLGALTETFALAPLLDRPVRSLSLGERMRCEIAASLLHAPAVCFLDEPTIGLDVQAKAAIRDLLRARSERDGATVLLTSHDTGDVESVCDRVLVLHEGRLLLDRPIGALRGLVRRKRVTCVTTEPDLALVLPGVRVAERAPHRTVFEVDTAETPVERVVEAALRAAHLQDLSVEDPPLETIVRELYARAAAGVAVDGNGR